MRASFPASWSFESAGESEYNAPVGFGAVTTSSTIGPREVKSTSRVYVTPGMRVDVETDSWLEWPFAAEAATDTTAAESATAMRGLRSTTRPPG